MEPNSPSISLDGFLRELGLAWQRLSLYQEGHPARREVVDRAQAVLAALTAARGSLSVGVSRDGFVGRDRKVVSGPVRRLAETLYQRQVALVRFAEQTSAEDLKVLLETIPRGRPAEDEPPLWDLLEERGVARVRLEPVDLSYVESEDGDSEDGDGETEDGPTDRPLWDSLLRTLLAHGEPDRPQEAEAPGAGGSLRGVLEMVERLLARRGLSLEDLEARGAVGPGPGGTGAGGSGAPAGGSTPEAVAALGASLGATLASHLAGGGGAGVGGGAGPGAGGGATGREAAELLRALPEPLSEVVLDRALAALVDRTETSASAERAAGFRSLAESLSTVRVVAALRRIRAAGVTFSPSVVALVDGLVAHAGQGEPVQTGPEELAGELAALFGDEDADRRLPSDEEIDRLALELARATPTAPDPEALGLRVETLTARRQLVQVSLTLLDLLERPFLKRPAQEAVVRRLGEVFRGLLAEGRLAQAMQIPERLQELRANDTTAPAADLGFVELRRPESAVAFLERPDDLPTSAGAVALRLAELLGYEVLDSLLEAMCEEEDLSRRRHVFDLMVSLGAPVVPRAQALLRDERWYVQRNMISLLRRVRGGLSAETLRHGLGHRDPRVRLEAVKGLGSGRPPAELIERAVRDPDPKVAQAAITAVGNHRLEAGRAPLLAVLEPLDPFGRQRSLRLRALEALGQLGDPQALETISHFLRPWFSPVSGEERRAAYRSLSGYRPEDRQPWLRKGRWSSDPEVRRICREIRQGAGEAS